ncbi:MAG TPA: hypothetical protein VIG33_17905, partial [Pseudobdellovibrionaceae bacterium]
FIYKASSRPRNHWMYVYDEDSAFARLHFPKRLTEQSEDPIQAVQAEVYSSKLKKLDSHSTQPERIVGALEKMGILKSSEIISSDIRFCKYANVIFDHQRKSNIDSILNFLNNNNIIPIGRFGKWAYLWSDESYLDGYNSLKNKFTL